MSKKHSNTVTVGRKMGKLEWQARFVVGKLRRGAKTTREDKLNCLGKIGVAMQRYGLNSIKDIKPGHVERYFEDLRSARLSPGRMANHATAMRMLCQMMGKADIVPSNKQLGCNRDMSNRTKHADERLNAAKASEVRGRLSENNRIAYDMSCHFGLRQKESLLSHEIVNINGVGYLVVEGAKGGRPRQIAITSNEQWLVIAQNIDYRFNHGDKLIDEQLTLKQGLRQLQNQLAASGASRESGCNMHSLRREYIIEQCQEILQSSAAERQQMTEELVESIGHGRIEVLQAYSSLLEDPPEN